MIIGLCGASGAGKSTVASLFRREGCRIIDCDALVHTLDGDPEYMERLSDAFGTEVVAEGAVDRKRLSAIVFSDGEKLKMLNGIIAPFVRRLVYGALGAAKKEGGITVLDAPLLFEYGLEAECDLTVGVVADPEIAIERLMGRDGKTREELMGRRSFQHDNGYYAAHCDVLLTNDGRLAELVSAFGELMARIRSQDEAALRKKRKRKLVSVLLFVAAMLFLAALAAGIRHYDDIRCALAGRRCVEASREEEAEPTVSYAVIALFSVEDIKYAFETLRYPRGYREQVEAAAERFGVEPNAVYAIIKAESDFCETAVSGAGAIGLMQVLPRTFAEDICESIGLAPSATALFDPRDNIEAGTYYFAKWFHYFGSYTEALASYNAGVGNVEKWLADGRYATVRGLIPENIPFAETRAYVARVMKYKEKYDALYGKTELPKKETVPEGVCYRLALRYGEEYGIDPRFILAVMKAESSFVPTAVSPSGALGIMQIMPATYEGDIKRRLSLEEGTEALFDAEFGIRCGSYYIYWLSGVFAGYPEIAAAYNGGIGNVTEWLADPTYSTDGITLIYDAIPSAQTKRYVEKVMYFYSEYCVRYPEGE